jgi:hypothetical protein
MDHIKKVRMLQLVPDGQKRIVLVNKQMMGLINLLGMSQSVLITAQSRIGSLYRFFIFGVDIMTNDSMDDQTRFLPMQCSAERITSKTLCTHKRPKKRCYQ